MIKIVVLTGAGVSAESGIKTFRDSDGLWEEYNINDVATPQAWEKNRALVLDFYNKRRKQVLDAKPNKAHPLFRDFVGAAYRYQQRIESVVDLVEEQVYEGSQAPVSGAGQ